MRCLHSPRCRTPARISGKDFPLPSHAGSNQPPLMLFFSLFLSFLPSPLYIPHGRVVVPILLPLFFFPFKLCLFRLLLGLRHLHTLLDRLFIGNPQRPDRHEALTLLCWLRCVSISFGLSDSVAARERCTGADNVVKCYLSFEQVSNGSQVMADSSFTTYDSVLSYYPLLSGRSLGQQEMADMPNLQNLRMQAAARRMTDNSSRNARICQFEVPGGGECRDTTCGDIHLSQLQVEPNGAQHPLTLCLSCHVIVLSARWGIVVWVWRVYRRGDRAISVRRSECGAIGSSASSGAYPAARGDL